MVIDSKRIGTLGILTLSLLLGLSSYAVRPKAEITMEGTLVEPIPEDSLFPNEPILQPNITCRRIDDPEIMALSSRVLAQQVEYDLYAKLSDYSSFPNIATLDDCGSFYVISSVSGSSSMGIGLQMIFQKTAAFFNGTIDKNRVLIFVPGSAWEKQTFFLDFGIKRTKSENNRSIGYPQQTLMPPK